MSSFNQQEPLEAHPLYEKVRTIGRGQRSFVQVARNKATGEQVAIKFIPRGWEPGHTKYVTREILNHQELSLSKHPHVVEFKEVFLTARYLAEVLEYVEGETLQVFLEKVGGKVIEGLARFIFQQLIIALDFCHRKGKVNRDIKLSNILLSIAEGQLPLVKLCDFGVSKDTYRHSEPHSQVGTALFVAPEVMQNFSGGRYDGQAADVWACGVCLFIMLFARHPYLRPEDTKLNEQQQMIKLFQRMMQNQIEFPLDQAPNLSADCLDLLTRLLKTDPNQRMNMADIQRHPWFLTALPEGAGLMNDMFLAEESTSLSPQSQSQIEALVGLAARLEDMTPTRVQLPSQAQRVAVAAAGVGGLSMPVPMSMPGTRPLSQAPGTLSAGGALMGGLGSAGMMPMSGVQVSGSPPVMSQQPQLSSSAGGMGMPALPVMPGRGHAVLGTSPSAVSQPQFAAGSYMQQEQTPQGLPSYPHAYNQQQVPGGLPPGHAQFYHASPPQPAHSSMHQGFMQGRISDADKAGSSPPLPPPPAPDSPVNMIPDLDAMIMSMPETDLLRAATIDIRQPQHVMPMNQQPMQGMQQMQASPGGGLAGMSNMQQQQSVRYGRGQPVQARMSAAPSAGSRSQGRVDPATYLYQGTDDDLPTIGSVSAVMPKFDWTSFNAPLLANHDSLQASQHFQASRFTRACRDVTAKLSESGRPPGGNVPPDHDMLLGNLPHAVNSMNMGMPPQAMHPSMPPPS